MKIIIDVDGDNVNVTTEPAHEISVNSELVALVTSPRPIPPPELLRAAGAPCQFTEVGKCGRVESHHRP